jgi:hypothetical protein
VFKLVYNAIQINENLLDLLGIQNYLHKYGGPLAKNSPNTSPSIASTPDKGKPSEPTFPKPAFQY